MGKWGKRVDKLLMVMNIFTIVWVAALILFLMITIPCGMVMGSDVPLKECFG